jgi:neutral trehalase
MCDEHAGLYFDYEFARGRRRQYPYLTTLYPLWPVSPPGDGGAKP